MEVNSLLTVEQSRYRRTAFGELAVAAERWTLHRADAVLAVSEPLRRQLLTQGVDPARAYVLPNGVNVSLFKPEPMKLFEYMGCGIPVVASAIGQIAQVVRHEETGLLYPPGDVDVLTAHCDRLLGNPEERGKFGKAGADVVHGRYTWSHNAARAVEIAAMLLQQRR